MNGGTPCAWFPTGIIKLNMSNLNLWSFSSFHSVAAISVNSETIPSTCPKWKMEITLDTPPCSSLIFNQSANSPSQISLKSNLPSSFSLLLLQFRSAASHPSCCNHSPTGHLALNLFRPLLFSIAMRAWYLHYFVLSLDAVVDPVQNLGTWTFLFSSITSCIPDIETCSSPTISYIFILLCCCMFCFLCLEYPHFPWLFSSGC